MILVSAIARPEPPVLDTSTGVPFDNVWSTPDGYKPSVWSTWTGKGEDLIVQRINVSPLFHRLVLVNRDTINAPSFTVDGTNRVSVPSGGAGWSRFYLDGTVVGLCDSSGTLRRRVVLTRDESLVFEGDMWSDYVVYEGSNEMLANEFADLAARFMDISWAPGAHQGADQQGAVVSIFNFLLVYTLWANQCPHFPSHGVNEKSVPEYDMLQKIEGGGSGNNAFGRLNEFTGVNGLLN
jgi:hypothetical protein